MYAVKKILVPIDFSDTSRAALSAALQIASLNEGAELFVLHVEGGMEDDVDQGSSEAADALQQIETDEAAILEAVELERSRCAEGGRTLPKISVTPRVAGGEWKEVATQMVDELQIDLIVTATHGPKGLKERILGADSQRLLGMVTCSVMVVKPKGYPYLRD
ncbi:MAG: universal stress protein [Myxococcota bacterium]|nr:universal stress protein [Myxococcota bacterium]